MRLRYHRQAEINRLRSQLEQTDFPKLKMMLIVGLAGGAGFLASYLMLLWGITSMAERYPVAIAIAYFVFLFLLWLWLNWLTTAVRRTIWSFVITAIIAGLGGAVLQSYFPGARSLGEVVHSHQMASANVGALAPNADR